MNDRELLELAAKAAGYGFSWSERYDCAEIWFEGDKKKSFWQPHRDDGDALRLARRLDISIEFLPDAVRCKVPGAEWIGETCLPCDTEHLGTAHRRAIVRAAAEIGRST